MKLPGMNSEIKPKRRREIYEDVASLSRPSGSYYVMMALSTVIAAYGLLINSAAVVVGAMLVAPLMGPIFGIALGLASGNRRLLWSSVQSEFVGILIALVVGVLIGLAPLRVPIAASEWLVRTQPTLYDLMIALASGLAGAYAVVDDRVSASLPGVAIAVAVLPPLASCGLAAAAANWEMAVGAMMLFIANFLAIQIAAAVVFSIFGMLRVERDPRARREEEEGQEIIQFFKRFWVSIVVLLVIAAFMTRTLLGLAVDRRIAATIEDVLSSQVSAVTGARLAETDFRRENGLLRVTARVLTPRPFEKDQVGSLEDELQEALDRDVDLIVRSLISRDMTRQGTVFAPREDEQIAEEERRRREFLRRASLIVSRHIQDIAGAELADVERKQLNGASRVTATVRAPEPIGPGITAEIERALQDGLSASLELVIRTVLIRDATSDTFLYVGEEARRADQREALGSAVRTSVDSWLDTNVEGAVVDVVEIESLEPRDLVVDILTPRAITRQEAQSLREALATTIGPAFEMTLRYELGGRILTGAPTQDAAGDGGGEQAGSNAEGAEPPSASEPAG